MSEHPLGVAQPISMPAAPPTRGVIAIHACRRALATHVESDIRAVLGDVPRIEWGSQPLFLGMWCADIRWRAAAGTAATLISRLARFPGIYAETSEEPTTATAGMRYAVVPELGIWACAMDAHGNAVLNEGQIRTAMTLPSSQVHATLSALLGEPWDAVLEPLRAAAVRPPAPLIRVV